MTVKPRQSILDVALSQTGTLESYIDILIDNNQDGLVLDSQEVQILDSRIYSKKVVSFFSINGTPATAPEPYSAPVFNVEIGSFSLSFSNSFL